MQKRLKIEAGLQALIHMQRARDFELLGFEIARIYVPDFMHTEFTQDAGEDGVLMQAEDATGRHWSLSCSLTGSLEKVRADCLKLKARGLQSVILVFIAATHIVQQTELKWRAEIQNEFGFNLLTIGREKIVSFLQEPRYNWISREFLPLKDDKDFQEVASQELAAGLPHSVRNLPSRSYSNLYGVGDTIDLIYSRLADDSGAWTVCLEGVGGIGKTTVADVVARRALASGMFSRLAWESFRNEDIGLRQGSGLEALVASIAAQLDLLTLAILPHSSRLATLQDELNRGDYLLVVDNLETMEDVAIVKPLLEMVSVPTRSRLLLTTRCSLPPCKFVWSTKLNELREMDALAFLRGEGEARGIEEALNRQDDDLREIYDLVGGNPLALNLVLGLMKYLPIDQVLDRLTKDKAGEVDEFYQFVYRNAWELITEDEKSILASMVDLPLAGSTIERIEYLSGLSITRLYDALQRLQQMSLVSWSNRLYSMHRLTRSFVFRKTMEDVASNG